MGSATATATAGVDGAAVAFTSNAANATAHTFAATVANLAPSGGAVASVCFVHSLRRDAAYVANRRLCEGLATPLICDDTAGENQR